MSGGENEEKCQRHVLKSSDEFHSKGGKLIRLEFAGTEVQRFGNVAIVKQLSSRNGDRRDRGLQGGLQRSSSGRTAGGRIRTGTPTKKGLGSFAGKVGDGRQKSRREQSVPGSAP